MARGNVKAMMICFALAKVDLDNPNISSGDEYQNFNSVFSNCIASDNTTFHTGYKLCRFNGTEQENCNDQSYGPGTSFITWNETIEQKWLLHLIDRTSNSQYSWEGIYYFYKISDE